MNLKLAAQLYKNMGTRYVSYRVRHELEKRMGVLKRKHPSSFKFNGIKVEEWKALPNNLLLVSDKNGCKVKDDYTHLKEKVGRILNNEVEFFCAEWINLGESYDWITNPLTKYKYDTTKHWSEIADLSDEAGDIKYVWEKSRFSYLLTLIRYDYHFKEDMSEYVFNEIESWIDANPINQGPNWRCGQEISIRILNWYYALEYYKQAKALTQERWDKIQNIIYASLHHVYTHIDFSRIAVRNNHAITETLFLTLSNILFPFIPETEKWAKNGKVWFEEEIKYQIYEDGTFLQFSMNYHRVVVQLLSLGISVYTRKGLYFNDTVYDRAYKSVNFLYQCMQDENGKLPNYGSNDGAWFFPLSDSDYRDYRPQLNALHYVLTGKDLIDSFDREESFWYGRISCKKKTESIVKMQGTLSFDKGGYYLCRQNSFFTFIRCGNHKDRPAQADNLHLDLWYEGENILRDSGTYQYNTAVDKLNYFMGTVSHNAVVVDNQSQMLKGGRFIWYYWTQKTTAFWQENNEYFVFKGVISAFRQLNSNASHFRTVKVCKSTGKWIVKDELSHLEQWKKKQVWHADLRHLTVKSHGLTQVIFDSFKSDYYGICEETKSIYYEFENKIETIIEFKA